MSPTTYKNASKYMKTLSYPDKRWCQSSIKSLLITVCLDLSQFNFCPKSILSFFLSTLIKKIPISKWKLCLTLIKGGARALSRAFLLRSASICRCRSILASFSRCRLSRSQVCNDHKSVCVHNGVEYFLKCIKLLQ